MATTTLTSLRSSIDGQLARRISRKTKRTIGQQVIRFLVDRERLLFDNESRQAHVIDDDGSVVPVPVKDSQRFRVLAWRVGINGSEPMYKWLLRDLEGAAYVDGKQVTLRRWVHSTNNAVYVSCGPTHLVKAKNGTLEKLPNGADDVLFAADATLAPWEPTTPVDPLKLKALRPPLRAPAEVAAYTPEVQYELLRVLLIALIGDIHPIPMLLPLGSKGGGKTTLIRGISQLFLGDRASLATISNDPRDFWTIVVNTPVAAFDNVDRDDLPKWLPDALAACVTGANYMARELYSDADVFNRRARALLAVSTRTCTFVRPDVAERVLPVFTVELQSRTSDREISEELACHRSESLSWLISSAWRLRQHLDTAPNNLPGRFTDFARVVWAWAAGFNEAHHVPDVLHAWEATQMLSIIESDPLITAIIEYLPKGMWMGRPGELTKDLATWGADLPFLGGGKAISRMLREASARLALVNIAVKEQTGAHTYWKLERNSSP